MASQHVTRTRPTRDASGEAPRDAALPGRRPAGTPRGQPLRHDAAAVSKCQAGPDGAGWGPDGAGWGPDVAGWGREMYETLRGSSGGIIGWLVNCP